MSTNVVRLVIRAAPRDQIRRTELRNLRAKLQALGLELDRIGTLGSAAGARACADLADKFEAVVGRVEALGDSFRESAATQPQDNE